MTDPEIVYRRLVSGDAGAVRDVAETLHSVMRDLDRAGDDVYQATGVPVWTGQGATAFQTRAAVLLQGVRVNHTTVSRARGALETAASAYDTANGQADHYISYWRNRPAGLAGVLEELLAVTVTARLVEVGRSYGDQLRAITAVLRGEDDVDLDELDEETRSWVEKGLEKNEDWLAGNGSGIGPLIPHTQATGDGRGWIPQGLAYDPATGLLLQSYYNNQGDPATVSLIDERSGTALTDVALGGYAPSGRPTDHPVPGHAGGVAIDGDEVYVSSEGRIYTYSLNDMQSAAPGDEVRQTRPPQEVAASSYTTFKDGQLYVGDFDGNTMYVYDKAPGGGWVPATGSDGGHLTVETPEKVQGVVVRDGEFVFSSSEGRGNESQLVVQDRVTGERGEPYTMPNMSEGVVEADGGLITTFESGAAEYDHADDGFRWPWSDKESDKLWATPYMTRTPLGELGLADDFEAEPSSLRRASAELGDPAASLRGAATRLAGADLAASLLGDVPAAATLTTAVTDLVGTAAGSVRTGAGAVDRLAEALVASGTQYEQTDTNVSRLIERLNP